MEWLWSMVSPRGLVSCKFGFKPVTKPLTEVVRIHGTDIHLYADDTQLYMSFPPHQSEKTLELLEPCVEDIQLWMKSHYLRLNDTKTEFMILGAPKDISYVTGWTVTVWENEILPSESG